MTGPALAAAPITPEEYVPLVEGAGLTVLAAPGGIYTSWADARERGSFDREPRRQVEERRYAHPDPAGFDRALHAYLTSTGRVV